MGAYAIETFRKTRKIVTCTVTITGISTLDGYTTTFTVKKHVDESENVFEVNGSNVGLVATFTIPAATNDIAARTYVYEVNVTKGAENYVVRQDEYVIQKSVKNQG